MNKGSTQEPRNILPDFIIPALALCFTIYYLTTITEVPWISQASAVTVSALLLCSIAAYVIRSVFRVRRGFERIQLEGAFSKLSGSQSVTIKRLILLLLVIAYVLVIERLGFTATTFLFLLASILLLSSRSNWKAALAVSLACSTVGYIVFIYFFKTRFPAGVVEHWIKSFS